jgi:hypothetical protein
MNNTLWKKKVEIEIKDICEKREVLRRLEGEVNNKKKVNNNGHKENSICNYTAKMKTLNN